MQGFTVIQSNISTENFIQCLGQQFIIFANLPFYKILIFSCLIHSRPEMKKTEKQLGVDFFSKVLPDISENFECMNPTMQDIVRLVLLQLDRLCQLFALAMHKLHRLIIFNHSIVKFLLQTNSTCSLYFLPVEYRIISSQIPVPPRLYYPRSSCKVISTQALQYGHMLTPEAGATQWMEEHEEQACGLLRKPLGEY